MSVSPKLNKIKFSIPYNGDIELVSWAIDSGQVYEVYFTGSGESDFSSQYRTSIPHKQKEIVKLIKLCGRNKIELNLLLNKPTLFFDNLQKIIAYIRSLEDYGGISSITISDPAIASFLKKVFPSIKLQSSIFLAIDNADKVKEAIKMGLSVFCLDASTNRDAAELRRIRDLKKIYPYIAIKLMANHGCYSRCFYWPQHSQWLVLNDIKRLFPSKQYKYMLGNLLNCDKCMHKVEKKSDEIKRPFIRPEDVTYYENNSFADYIKILHRNDSSQVLKHKMEAYFKRSYSGNLFKLLESTKFEMSKFVCDNRGFPKGFIEKVSTCGTNCHACDYCDRVSNITSRSTEDTFTA